ncbi:MAG: PilZ domain-containing protein [Chloroflexota bacterium]
MPERRKLNRRDFSYYMRVMNEQTGELIGHLADISTGGFKLESRTPVQPNQQFVMRMDLTNEISEKDYFVFVARSRWCTRHPIDPTLYNIGCQIIEMAPEDLHIFVRIFEKYGSPVKPKNKNSTDYLWR